MPPSEPTAPAPGGGVAPDAAWALLDAVRGQAEPQTVLVCASARIAQSWLAEDARRQRSAGRQAWRSAPIVAVDRFLRQSYERAALRAASAGDALPAVLESTQERALWRGIVEQAARARLLRVDEAARLAAEAWRLVRDWRLTLPIADGAHNADVAQFNDWAERFRQRLQRLGCIDAAALPQALADAARKGHAAFPATVLVAGFDSFTPALAALLATMAQLGGQVRELQIVGRSAEVSRVTAADAEREARAAAAWARAALDGGASRIGVIVTDLRARRAAIEQIFGQMLPAGSFGIGVSEPLADASMIQAALRLLALRAGALPVDEVSALLLSPYWDGDVVAREARARLDFRLRKDGYATLDLAQLASLAAALKETALAERLRRLLLLGDRRERLSPALWAQRFAEWLDAAGWPGTRAADAREQEIAKRWAEALGELGALAGVLPSLSASGALVQLRDVARHARIADAAALAPVQVLAPRDSAGLTFDRLRVLGLDDQRWPLLSRPSPLLPFALQRRLGMQGADATRALAEATALTQHWLGAADEVVLSYALVEEDRELKPSPLLPDVPERAAEAPALPSVWTQTFAARQIETIDDAAGAPPAMAAPLAGGTSLFKDQAACPFRAYARHRLGAEAPEEPPVGLDGRDRGNLTHEALHHFWDAVRTQATLIGMDEAARAAQVRAAVEHALQRMRRKSPQKLGASMARLEQRRLETLLGQWLQLEIARDAFEVLEIEGRAPGSRDDPRVSSVQGVEVKIRPDRIDRLAGGGALVLDYKTGEARTAPWRETRPDEPQLLIYALDRGDAAGVAFAQVRVGKLGFRGIADVDGVADGIGAFGADNALASLSSWPEVIERWRGEIAQLGGEIRAGFAAVLPKPQACEQCDLHAFCRVRQSMSALAASDEPQEPS